MTRSPSSSNPDASVRLGRPPKLDDARARILAEAAALFAEQGYETSSLSELAARLGLTKPAIYHYYSSKQDLFDAVILETLTGLVANVEEALADTTGPCEKLRRFMVGHARYFAGHRDGFVTMLVGFGGMKNTEFREDSLVLRRRYEQLLRDIVSEGVETGAFRQVDPVVTARAILSMLSWMVRWFQPSGGKTAEEIALEYVELLALER
ncbi:TetR/AcrR family transcriptional regulator [Aquamicrobium sp. LC103]|uniref:TetR/AcrR family transcriptional regulator n=1 Tax=Aquamicrobium sp. LC103 TaxID=1120658 RepID=UPI00063E7826|nr:TetR/AcrR family transcriptional regulator [Aquamicrobium sp. LC103]TKT69642.1 TetR/AcrR family transcriptional regulator [Aquamicrobium sp. LC103]